MSNRQKIVAFTGAGISAESGLDTFRDKNGLWMRLDVVAQTHRLGVFKEDFYEVIVKAYLIAFIIKRSDVA